MTLFTNLERFRRHLSSFALCIGCGLGDESWLHILRDCPYARDVWKELQIDGASFNLDGLAWIKEEATSKIEAKQLGLEKGVIFLFTIWAIWKSRNKMIFEGTRPPADVTATRAIAKAREFQSATAHAQWPIQSQRKPCPCYNWSPPPQDFTKLNTNGSVVNGIAAAGGLLRDPQGQWVAGFSMNIGPSSIHDSELWGLRQGLFIALQLNLKKLIVESDSLEVIQALDPVMPPNPLSPALLFDCRGLMQKLTVVTLLHVPRESNLAADHLAKIGHQLPHGVTIHPSAPSSLLSILCNDIPGLVP